MWELHEDSPCETVQAGRRYTWSCGESPRLSRRGARALLFWCHWDGEMEKSMNGFLGNWVFRTILETWRYGIEQTTHSFLGKERLYKLSINWVKIQLFHVCLWYITSLYVIFVNITVISDLQDLRSMWPWGSKPRLTKVATEFLAPGSCLLVSVCLGSSKLQTFCRCSSTWNPILRFWDYRLCCSNIQRISGVSESCDFMIQAAHVNCRVYANCHVH